MSIKDNQLQLFKDLVWNFYKDHQRNLEWRNPPFSPYHIVVSEIMLQQTQVSRVQHKFKQFIEAFPDFNRLAKASLPEVLSVWQGMGYNRRGVALQKIAQIITQKYDGVLPSDPSVLIQLPQVGKNTAASITAFAYNTPVVFIETNIRRVFIHHFFEDKQGIDDKEILPLVSSCLETNNSRNWYYALMDYGTYLATIVPNPNRKSKHYTKQSKFEGSNRQIRSKILKILLEQEYVSEIDIIKKFDPQEKRIQQNLKALQKEGFLVKEGKIVYIKK